MEDINKELSNTVKREVMIKQAVTSAKDKADRKRPLTRRAIEDLNELARIEKEYILDVD
jgi:hypothetical protein